MGSKARAWAKAREFNPWWIGLGLGPGLRLD